ncbi:restriction endonuclease subunit S [Spiroplasma endosymbiont of Polydrusus pterygomalis]|uniref:restriction endonuclease subunit S n=1 Tax=Spiroplasma endosymbiont of Polydrusus pterygomalis TaxID=3139327 RepID=UPI003CCB3DC9
MNKFLVPKIRFKGFNDEWKKYKINEIYKLKRGCVISKEILSKNKEANFFLVYSSQTSNNGIMGWTNSYLFEKNKIIWTTDGANAGTIRFVNEKFYASNVCGVLIGKKDHYNNYSFAISINLEAKKHVNKNGNPKLMNNIMGNINFYNSKSKNEQTKVAQFFTIIDKKIELVKEQLSLLAKQKQYYLNNMFANEKGYPKIRFKGFNDEWESKKIGEILKIKHGKNQSKIEIDNGKYPILGTGGIIGKTNTPIYQYESVLIGRKGTIDKPQFMDSPFWTVDTLFYSIIKSNAYPRFIYYLFQTINWKKYNESTGVPSLTSFIIENIEIFTSLNYKEQNLIGQFFSIIDRKIELVKEQLSLLAKQKQYYLNNMFI